MEARANMVETVSATNGVIPKDAILEQGDLMVIGTPLGIIQAWLEALDGAYNVQKLQNGHVLFSLQQGTVGMCVIRPTFTEAAEACLLSFSAKTNLRK